MNAPSTSGSPAPTAPAPRASPSGVAAARSARARAGQRREEPRRCFVDFAFGFENFRVPGHERHQAGDVRADGAERPVRSERDARNAVGVHRDASRPEVHGDVLRDGVGVRRREALLLDAP